MNRNTTCCLTGHRPIKLPWGYDETNPNCIKFKKDLKINLIKIIKKGYTIFLTGIAEGFDMIATELLLKLQRKYKDIQIIAVLPCKNQEILWSKIQQKRYHKIIKKCNDRIFLNEKYTYNCMFERNNYMVKNSSLIIACYNGKSGGTANTIKLAQQNNCKIYLIDINKYK